MPNDGKAAIFSPVVTRPWVAVAVVVYVALALGVDVLASSHAVWTFGVFHEGFHWSRLHLPLARWQAILPLPDAITGWMKTPVLRYLDVYKLTAWLVIPLLLSLPGMDWGALGFRRWKRVDLYVLAGLGILGIAAVLLITQVEALRQYYPSLGSHSAAWKAHYLAGQLVWIGSWLLGWEFMHRYFLLRQVNGLWPRFGWLAAPFFEGAYHLTKLPIEMAGMVAIALVFTWWCRARANILLPLIVHLLIELALPLTRILL